MICYIHNTEIKLKEGSIHTMYDGKHFCGLDCQMRYVRSMARLNKDRIGAYDVREFDNQIDDSIHRHDNYPLDFKEEGYTHF